MAEQKDDKTTIGGVNMSDTSDSNITIGNISADVKIEGDVVKNKTTVSRPILIAISVILLAILAFTAMNFEPIKNYVFVIFTPPPFTSAAEGEALIVVATFHHTEGVADSDIQGEIRRAIKDAANERGFDNLRVEVEPTSLRAEERDEAKALGEEYNASMIIWGEDTGVRKTVNFLNLKQPDFDAAKVKTSETESSYTQMQATLANPKPFSGFVTEDIPAQMTFLSLFAVGQSYYSQAEYDKAIEIIKAAVDSLSADTLPIEGVDEAYYGLGWLYQTTNELAKAIDAYGKVIELNPDFVKAYVNRGVAHNRLDNYEQAIEDFDKAIELNPDYADAYYNRGNAYSASGDYEQAIKYYTKAIELNPDDADTYHNQGNAYAKSGDYEQAIKNYTKAIELNPDLEEAYYNRGNAYKDSRKYEQAITDYKKAIELNPDLAEAYYNRGAAYADSGDYEQAIKDFERYLELAPDASDRERVIINIIEQLKAELGDQKQAIRDYDKAIELNPDDANAYYNRGNAYGNSGDYKQAIDDFDKAIELNPDYTEAYNNRGVAHNLLDNYEQAIEDFDKAIKLKPDDVNAYVNRGGAYVGLGDYEQAINDYKRYLELAPDSPKRGDIITLIELSKAELEK